MSARLTHAEMAEIFTGEANSRRQFMDLHRSKKDRPQTWFQQNDRSLSAFEQARDDYQRAASRTENAA